jgi:hypothetical protein
MKSWYWIEVSTPAGRMTWTCDTAAKARADFAEVTAEPDTLTADLFGPLPVGVEPNADGRTDEATDTYSSVG